MLCNAFILVLVVTACTAVPPNIMRPCNNYKCIAQTLASKSTCNLKVRGFIPFAYEVKSFPFNTPYFNATYVDNNLIVRNHDKCYISQFFINRKTSTLVLGVDCPYLQLQSTRTVIQHYSLREDSYYSYDFKGTYPLIRLTVNMSLKKPINLCNSFAFADVAVMPIFNIIPTDKDTADFLSTDLSFMNIFERESFAFRANPLLRRFINSRLCDFGCD